MQHTRLDPRCLRNLLLNIPGPLSIRISLYLTPYNYEVDGHMATKYTTKDAGLAAGSRYDAYRTMSRPDLVERESTPSA